MKRELALEFSCVTEAAALAGYKWLGRGDKNKADNAAVEAMRIVLNQTNIDGEIAIGEGEIDDALYSGEDELNEFELQSAYDDLMQYFIEEFGGKANISKDDFHSIKYYNYTLNLPIEFKTILYAKDMVKWWDNVLSEIGKQGPKTFFGFDYDYDDSEG